MLRDCLLHARRVELLTSIKFDIDTGNLHLEPGICGGNLPGTQRLFLRLAGRRLARYLLLFLLHQLPASRHFFAATPSATTRPNCTSI